MNKKWQVSSLIASALLLGACGGSGSSDMTGQDNHNSNQVSNKTVLVKFEPNDKDEDGVNSLFYTLNGRQFAVQNNELFIDFSVLEPGLKETIMKAIIDSNDGRHGVASDSVKSYNQFHSVVVGLKPIAMELNGQPTPDFDAQDSDFSIGVIAGQPTVTAHLPNQGRATYNGVAFTERNNGMVKGDFVYHVNFADKTGHGYFAFNQNNRIDLAKGTLLDQQHVDKLRDNIEMNKAAQTMFSGDAVKAENTVGQYVIGLYGPHAEEAAGAVKINNRGWKYGLGGKRGDIK